MERKHFIGIVILIAAILVMIVFVYPIFLEQSASSNLIFKSQEELTKQQVLIREVKSIEKRYKKIENEVLRVSDLMPRLDSESIPNLFIELEGIANTNGLLIDVISFRINDLDQDDEQENNYKTITALIEMKGLYNDIKRFSTAIETNKHLMDIISLFIVPIDAVGANEEEEDVVKNEDIDYRISIDVYYQ